MREPRRISDINALEPYVKDRVERILKALKRRGFTPRVFETRRTPERQNWLYGIGRTHKKNLRPVTYTRNSKHLTGKAADIICAKRLWDNPQFFAALKEEAAKEGMHTLDFEGCHIEWRG